MLALHQWKANLALDGRLVPRPMPPSSDSPVMSPATEPDKKVPEQALKPPASDVEDKFRSVPESLKDLSTRLSELSKRDLNMLRESREHLYRFPSQVPAQVSAQVPPASGPLLTQQGQG